MSRNLETREFRLELVSFPHISKWLRRPMTLCGSCEGCYSGHGQVLFPDFKGNARSRQVCKNLWSQLVVNFLNSIFQSWKKFNCYHSPDRIFLPLLSVVPQHCKEQLADLSGPAGCWVHWYLWYIGIFGTLVHLPCQTPGWWRQSQTSSAVDGLSCPPSSGHATSLAGLAGISLPVHGGVAHVKGEDPPVRYSLAVPTPPGSVLPGQLHPWCSPEAVGWHQDTQPAQDQPQTPGLSLLVFPACLLFPCIFESTSCYPVLC